MNEHFAFRKPLFALETTTKVGSEVGNQDHDPASYNKCKFASLNGRNGFRDLAIVFFFYSFGLKTPASQLAELHFRRKTTIIYAERLGQTVKCQFPQLSGYIHTIIYLIMQHSFSHDRGKKNSTRKLHQEPL